MIAKQPFPIFFSLAACLAFAVTTGTAVAKGADSTPNSSAFKIERVDAKFYFHSTGTFSGNIPDKYSAGDLRNVIIGPASLEGPTKDVLVEVKLSRVGVEGTDRYEVEIEANEVPHPNVKRVLRVKRVVKVPNGEAIFFAALWVGDIACLPIRVSATLKKNGRALQPSKSFTIPLECGE